MEIFRRFELHLGRRIHWLIRNDCLGSFWWHSTWQTSSKAAHCIFILKPVDRFSNHHLPLVFILLLRLPLEWPLEPNIFLGSLFSYLVEIYTFQTSQPRISWSKSPLRALRSSSKRWLMRRHIWSFLLKVHAWHLINISIDLFELAAIWLGFYILLTLLTNSSIRSVR